MISTEQIAFTYRSRPGFRLVDYGEVALPVFRLTLQVVLLDKRPILPIEEFVLRAVDAGLVDVESMGSFLGLERSIVEGALTRLLVSGDVQIGAPPGDIQQTVLLTAKGRASVADSAQVTSDEKQLMVCFDRITRRLARYEPALLLRPRDVRDKGLREVPPPVVGPPQLGDLSVQELTNVLAADSRYGLAQRELLAVRAIERKERFYLPAVALVYRAETGTEMQVAFAVEGKVSSEHEDAFAAAGGIRKGLLISGDTPDPGWRLDAAALGVDLEAGIRDEGLVQEIRTRQFEAQMALNVARGQIDDESPPDSSGPLYQTIAEATKEIEEAKRTLDGVPTRFLDVYEHPGLLAEALSDATERLMIISPWIRAGVVNRRFVSSLEALLLKGVRVYIGYGLGPEEHEKRLERDIAAENDLRTLERVHADFVFRRLGDTHAKLLLCDDKFVILTSFNWLSFRGDPDRTYRDEQGVIITDPVMVNRKFDQQLPRFQEEV